jgi:hypothetical protein
VFGKKVSLRTTSLLDVVENEVLTRLKAGQRLRPWSGAPPTIKKAKKKK